MLKRFFIPAFIFAVFMFGTYDRATFAQCINCIEPQCSFAAMNVTTAHEGGLYIPPINNRGPATWNGIIRAREPVILTDWRNAFSCYRSWLVGDDSNACFLYCATAETGNIDFSRECNRVLSNVPEFWTETVLKGLMVLTEQMSAVAVHSSFMIGKFFDAEAQLETQRLLQVRQFEAHRDYMPSENICMFGSAMQQAPALNAEYDNVKLSMNATHIARALREKGQRGAANPDGDIRARWDAFRTKYCDPKDNNWTDSDPEDGLYLACKRTITPKDYPNKDIDFTGTVDLSRTTQNGFSGPGARKDAILMLSYNLYGHDPLSGLIGGGEIKTEQGQNKYFKLRSIEAKRSVARNSFLSHVALKSNVLPSNEFYGDIHRALGEDDLLTKNIPVSRYMALEAVSKKIYQDPKFFSNLYDKPANVSRASVSLKAAELMLDRAMFESELRQEMALSVLLSAEQNEKIDKVNKILGNRVNQSTGGR